MTLDIAIATHTPQGIKHVAEMDLPLIDGVRYVISWQAHENSQVPGTLLRDDVDILRFDQVGQSLNRNNAINHCSADIILLGDDDLIYNIDGLKKLIQTFENDPELCVATFKGLSPINPDYPDKTCILKEPYPKNYWAAAYLIAFRREKIGGLLCHPMLGLGPTKLNGAEDEFFLLSAIRRGYKCMFFPITICQHPDYSTGLTSTLSPGTLRAHGFYITVAYPRSFLLRLPLKAWRVARKRQAPFFKALFHILVGACHTPEVLHCDKRFRW